MAEIEERVEKLELRVERMDMELKEHFDDQRLFIRGALDGVERRMRDGFARVEARIDKMDRDMHAAFAGMDAKLSVLIDLARDGGTRRSRRR